MNVVKKKVKIRLLSEMLGTVPANKDIYTQYIESKKPGEIEDVEVGTVKENDERGYTVFHQDEKGLFVYDYFIKGFFKNAGNVLKDELKIKNLKSKLTDLLFVMPRKIYFKKKKADGILERSLRAQTQMWPRVTLIKSDFIDSGTELEFELHLVAGRQGKDGSAELKVDLLEKLLEYGAYQGLGQFRNGGYGRFEVISIK